MEEPTLNFNKTKPDAKEKLADLMITKIDENDITVVYNKRFRDLIDCIDEHKETKDMGVTYFKYCKKLEDLVIKKHHIEKEIKEKRKKLN
jgi:hypothetical protein